MLIIDILVPKEPKTKEFNALQIVAIAAKGRQFDKTLIPCQVLILVKKLVEVNMQFTLFKAWLSVAEKYTA